MQTNNKPGDDRLYGMALHMLILEVITKASQEQKKVTSTQITKAIIDEQKRLYNLDDLDFSNQKIHYLKHRVGVRLTYLTNNKIIERIPKISKFKTTYYEYFKHV